MLLSGRIILKEIKIACGILQFYYKTRKPLEINVAILYYYYARIATGGVLSPDAPKKYRRNTMKNISRILALVLALTMVIGAFASVSAAKATWYNDAVEYLESIGVADIGTKAGTKITRAEFALMVAKIDSTWVNTEWWDENGVLADTVVFKDQADTDKAHRAAICYAYQRALIAGDGDGNFRPNATITFAEASVVIVRLMGFQNDVPENGDQWEYNWIYAANKFCHAFDRTFMSNVDTVNPKYELSYGEAAYLLATILNWGNDSDDVLCLTKKGENLGKNFPWGGAGTSSDVVRVEGLTMDATNQVVLGGALDYEGAKVAGLFPISGSGATGDGYPIEVDELEKLVRISLGLSATRDTSGETLDTFNLGDYIQNGTLLKVKRVDDEVTAVSLFSEKTGAKSVSDTILVATAVSANDGTRTYNYDGSVKNPGKYPKLANAIGTADATPQLPLAYTSATYTDANGATQYTHAISFAGNKLVYKGASDKAVEYTVVSNSRSVAEDEIVVFSEESAYPLTAAEAKALIPNTATGEARVEFYDIDGDGYYDIAVVISASKFGTGVVASVVKGKVTITVKSNYQKIDVATVSSGVIAGIETSGKKTINGKEYFICTVATLGKVEETKTVYIPVPVFDAEGNETYANRADSVKLTYTIAGATNTVEVDSKDWTPFLDTLKNTTTGTISDIVTPADFKGLVYNKAVSYVLASDIDSTATGDAANVVVYLADTAAASAADTGFIVKVEKTETGDNTFKVTLASAKNVGAASAPVYAAGNILDARFSYFKVAVSGQAPYTDSAMPKDATLNDVTIRQALTALGIDVDTYMAKEAKYTEYHLTSAPTTIKQIYAPVHQVSNILVAAAEIVNDATDATVFDKKISEFTQADAIAQALCQLGGHTWSNAYVEYEALNKDVTLAEVFTTIGCDKDTFYAFVKSVGADKAKEYAAIVRIADALRYTSTTATDINTVSAGVKVVNEAGDYLQSVVSSAGFDKVSGVKTYEVRASASYLWDIENYDAYHKIFATSQNAYQFQNEASDSKVTDADFIYVSILKDASSQQVLKYLNVLSSDEVSTSSADISITKNPNMTVTGKYTFTQESAGAMVSTWTQYQSILLIGDIDTAAVEAEAKAALKAGATTFTKEATTKVAKDPYYEKTPSASAKFVKKWSVANAKVTFTAVQDMTEGVQTYVPVVDKNGAQVKVLTDAEKAYWESQITPDGMPYKVIDKLLYRVNTTNSVPKVDANGDPVVKLTYDVSYEGLTWTVETVADEDFAKVSTVKTRALDPTADKGDYLPGYYYVDFDGTKYKADESATIIVMTPDAKTGNLNGSTTTVKAFTEAGKDLFVSYEQVTTSKDGDLTVLGVIGEYVDGIVAPEPGDDKNDYKIVYLGKTGTTLEATEYGKDILVKSTYSAVEVPAGTEFGSIYYRYSTYAEAKYATTIDATLPVGYYAVTADGEIKGSTGIAKKGAILSVDAQGNLKVDLNNDGKEVVDGTNFKWEFFYVDFDGNYKKAGDSTAVTLVNYKLAIQAQITTLENNIKNAQAEYDKIVAEEIATGEKRTAAKITAKENIAKAEQALADYKVSAEAKNLNGKFWGTANSPAYTYVVTYRYTYQMEPERITFQYIVVDGTYCVLVNSILQ